MIVQAHLRTSAAARVVVGDVGAVVVVGAIDDDVP